MIHEHNEIEVKLNADHVSFDSFHVFIQEQFSGYYEFKHVMGPDYYYEAGSHVVRHRNDRKDKHELTVKRRKSESSTCDREEIDLQFSEKTTREDVDAFLQAIGFRHVFTIVKDAYIYWVHLTQNVRASFVIYDVWLVDEMVPKRFIEVEIEKGSEVSVGTAKRHLRTYVKKLQDRYGLNVPLNESLYEIYSGKRYQVVAA